MVVPVKSETLVPQGEGAAAAWAGAAVRPPSAVVRDSAQGGGQAAGVQVKRSLVPVTSRSMTSR